MFDFHWPHRGAFTDFEIFDITAIFHRNNGENYFQFRFGGHACFGFPPQQKVTSNHVITRDSTLVASLVKIGEGLRSVERSAFFRVTDSLTDWLTDTQTKWFLPERDYVTFGSLLSQFRLSDVCRLSVVCLSSATLVHPTQVVEPFGKISSPLCTLAILWPPCKTLRR